MTEAADNRDDFLHQGDDKDHPHDHADLDSAVKMLSIGIDIGSATSHFCCSELYIGQPAKGIIRKPAILHRHVLYESPIRFTPFRGQKIDAEAIKAFIDGECNRVGLTPDDMDTGALICTGEAAKTANAAAVASTLAGSSGKFVAVTAGHHLEAVLGSHGSGAVDASRDSDTWLVSLDVGGATSKRTLILHGRIIHTSALNVGSRLIALDEDGRVTRVDSAARAIAGDVGLQVERGERLSIVDRKQIAERMADCLVRFLELAPLDSLTRRLLLTDLAELPGRFDLAITGGLAEYFYGRELRDMGDLGPFLSQALRTCLPIKLRRGALIEPKQGIRATVIGASQYSMQVTGETVFLKGGLGLPLRNVPVCSVELDWNNLTSSSVRRSIFSALEHAQSGQVQALSFREPSEFGYGSAFHLGALLASVLEEAVSPGCGVVLMFEHNIGATVGSALIGTLERPFLCLDEILVDHLDYLDIGLPMGDDMCVPIVVKSLLLS